MLYFDYQYNDSLALMHEDARDDAISLSLAGVDARMLDIRLLAPVDLAVSKLARFAEVDRSDITELARKHLIQANALRQRATAALVGYIGDLTRLRRFIELACSQVEDCERRSKG